MMVTFSPLQLQQAGNAAAFGGAAALRLPGSLQAAHTRPFVREQHVVMRGANKQFPFGKAHCLSLGHAGQYHSRPPAGSGHVTTAALDVHFMGQVLIGVSGIRSQCPLAGNCLNGGAAVVTVLVGQSCQGFGLDGDSCGGRRWTGYLVIFNAGVFWRLVHSNPVVIIDESHNFEANLRVDMLKAINPCFILDLTATPRNKSNIISFVDAIKLKRANMVKLPVIVYNHRSTNDVISSAIQMQRSLEQKAIAMEANGGRYIRPIVLFQAQPKTDDDNITFDKIKSKLIEVGIPEEYIKIKTANKDEIKNTDLMSRDCQVRYIITVNALKEGWDCPFAYILASLANKTSRVDVEQILGRVLRLPYTTKHKEELLDLSYVFTSSNDFRNTVENVIEGLNRAGFSKKDYRVAECSAEPVSTPTELPSLNLFGCDEPAQDTPTTTITDDIDEQIDPETIKTTITTPAANTDTVELESFARQENENYNRQAAQKTDNNDIPNDIKDMVTTYPIKDIF